MEQSHCYCGNPKSFQDCCAPLLSGQTFATTAEQLMRSRFSAFSTANIDYLIATHHPSKRTSDDRQQLNDSLRDCRWLKLTIHNTHQGLTNEQKGEVDFTASYTQANKLYQLREKSQFVKEGGQWFYLDGFINKDINTTASIHLGRNDPCWCGSNKKFKKCHGK